MVNGSVYKDNLICTYCLFPVPSKNLVKRTLENRSLHCYCSRHLIFVCCVLSKRHMVPQTPRTPPKETSRVWCLRHRVGKVRTKHFPGSSRSAIFHSTRLLNNNNKNHFQCSNYVSLCRHILTQL